MIAVVTGLVAMHGLGSASPLPAGPAMPHAAHQTVTAPAAQQCACPDDDGSTDRHASHADQMCASGAVPGAVFVPALAACAPSGTDTTSPPPVSVSYGPDGGRAPPTLAQLQLLRI
ncbi:DUF6153 family protein [Streptomyces sp. NPDC012438]|uniref:DUF6153 family protein n=1 Tax=Streptomyces sp. NPDC012438 TaxID=3364833 RepID=UPI0036E8B22B